MKIDMDYLKQLLEAFESASGPYIDIDDLEANSGIEFDDTFIFHMDILCDRGLVQQQDGSSGFGLQIGADGHFISNAVPLRLTADGHDFLEALRNKEVWQALKTNFKDASLDTLADVSKALLKGFIKKKTQALTGIEL